MRIRPGLVPFVTFVVAVAVACTANTPGPSGSPPSPPPAAHHATGSAGQQVTKLPATLAAAQASPKQLRAQFEQLLGLHTLLAVRVMRNLVVAAPDLQKATVASLQENTDALSLLVASAYGGAQGDRFKQLWQRHISELSAYANGVAGNDAPAKQTARAALLAYCDAYGAWFAQASKGRIKASDAVGGVRMHVEELMKQIDVYAARDYDQAYRIERQAYEHMFTAGATLAKSSVTPELAVGVDAAPAKLRSAFAMLLGQHMELIVEAQQATFAGPPQFKAAAAQVNANTTALTQAMGAIVGPKEAAEFQSAWANHVEGLMAYTAAVAAKDEPGKQVAKKNLDGFAERLGLYFSDIVKNVLAADPLTEAITAHDGHLINHVDAYAAKDYSNAQQMELEGYQQMLGVANTLVDAIQRTVNPQLPTGGPKTGAGGTAHPPP